jgi:hypothetical protein
MPSGCGVIAREAKDRWPPDTILKLVTHLRQRKPQLSDEQRAYHQARADREKLKYAVEIGKLGSTEEMVGALDTFTGWYLTTLDTLPGAIRKARQDRELRAELKKWVFDQCNALSEKAKAAAAAIKEGAEIKIWL